jgi:prepilin-type N-terminal cleavage/methylation domain-containing protein/prepilin-type processing-associated H-X9-DG protein
MKARSTPRGQRMAGFTLVELLVVIAIIGLLASLMLPALAKAKSKSHRISCLSNIKQLSICWASYTQDHNGKLPESYFAQSFGAVNTNAWVRGTVDDNPAFGQVEPYNTSPGVYRCPSDKSLTASSIPRVRSYSINSWMGGVALPGEDEYRVFRKETDIVSPAPSQAVVFVDEHEKSINEGWFVIDMDGRGLFDAPATRHDGTFTLSFADGHVEAWKLKSEGSRDWTFLPVPPNSDSERLRLSASSLK